MYVYIYIYIYIEWKTSKNQIKRMKKMRQDT